MPVDDTQLSRLLDMMITLQGDVSSIGRDVASMKSAADGQAALSAEQVAGIRADIASVRADLAKIDDRLEDHESRLDQFDRDKARVLGFASALGIGSGGVGAYIASLFR